MSKGIEHASQHIEAIQRHLRVTSEVSTSIFDDKVREMGWVKVGAGKIEICFSHLPGMVSKEDQRSFIIDAISLALTECYEAHPDAFDPHSDLSQREKGAIRK